MAARRSTRTTCKSIKFTTSQRERGNAGASMCTLQRQPIGLPHSVSKKISRKPHSPRGWVERSVESGAAEDDEHLAAGAGDVGDRSGAAEAGEYGRLGRGTSVDGQRIAALIRRATGGSSVQLGDHFLAAGAHREELGALLADADQNGLVARRPRLADVVVARYVPATITALNDAEREHVTPLSNGQRWTVEIDDRVCVPAEPAGRNF